MPDRIVAEVMPVVFDIHLIGHFCNWMPDGIRSHFAVSTFQMVVETVSFGDLQVRSLLVGTITLLLRLLRLLFILRLVLASPVLVLVSKRTFLHFCQHKPIVQRLPRNRPI